MKKADVLKAMVLRTPKFNPNQLYPKAKLKMAQVTQEPQPLKYKLQEVGAEFNNYSEPLGLKEKLPFHIERTTSNNLPVYREYRNVRTTKRTVIRNLSGDVSAFCDELKKVVSNQDITVKVGSVVVKGLHKETVTLWLARLGF